MKIVFVNGTVTQEGDVITVTAPTMNACKWESDKEIITDIEIDLYTGEITSLTKQKLFLELIPESLS